MADLKVKISEFPLATESKDTDDFAILQDGKNKRIKSPKLEEKLLVKVEDRYVNKNQLGVSNGVATLGSDGKLSESQRFAVYINPSFIPIDLTTPPSEVDGVFLPTTSGVYENYGGLSIDLDLGSYLITKIGDTYKSILLAVESTLIANNIEDLRSKEPAYEGQIITLLGYYEAGDKDPLNYKWTSEQGIDDGGAVINTESGSWLAVIEGKVNVMDFGAKGDGVQNETAFIRNAYKACNGREVVWSQGVYKIDYLQLSGTIAGENFVSGGSFIAKGIGDVIIVPRSYLGETPPPSLGMNYGFTASTFALNGFDKVVIDNIKCEGVMFDDFANDWQPVTGAVGTINPFHTRTRFININYCNNITVSNVKSEKMFSSIRMRGCNNITVSNVTHTYSYESFIFEECTGLNLSDMKSYHARFRTDPSTSDNFLKQGQVWDEATGEILYTLFPNNTDENIGMKTSAGYGFLLNGCKNATLKDSYSYMAGSECFRVQNGAAGVVSENIKVINCTSEDTRRYAFATRRVNMKGVVFESCVAINAGNVDSWYGTPPLTESEALDISNYTDPDIMYSTRIPSSSCVSFFATDCVFKNCKSYSKNTIYYNDSGETELSKIPIRYFGSNNRNYAISNHIQISNGNSYSEIDGCITEGGTTQSLITVISSTGLDGGDVLFKNNTIKTYQEAPNAPAATAQRLFNTNGYSGKITSIGNTYIGGRDCFYILNTENANFKSVNDTVIDSGRSALVSINPISINAKFYNLNVRGARFLGFFQGRAENILFDNPTYELTADGSPFSFDSNLDRIHNCYIKEGSEYVMFVNAGTSGGSFIDNRWRVADNVLFNKVLSFEVTNFGAGSFDLIKKSVFRPELPTGAVDFTKIYNSSDVERVLRFTASTAGTGMTQFIFTTSSDDIPNYYKVYYNPLKDGSLF